jgi:phosphate-selective porin
MKKVILSLAVIAATISANAQTKVSSSPIKISVGVEAVAPFGDFAKTSKFGIGGSIQGDYNVDPTLAITLNAGYIDFLGKDQTITYPGVGNVTVKHADFGLIPVLAGIKYSFTPQLYGSAQLGVSFSTEKNGGSNFTYAPGIGYKFSDNFDILAKYTGYSVKSSGSGNGSSSLNTAGVRLAYTF